jgi:hypothetical protein
MKWLAMLEKSAVELMAWRPGGARRTEEEARRIEEPPFEPFDLSAVRSGRAAARLEAAAGPERPPATLAELGVPGELARNLEVTFRAMGATAGGRVAGFRFRTPDGASGPIRLDDAA